MKSHFRSYATLLGLLVAALASYGLWQLWHVPADAAWTPAHLSLPLETTADRFEVLVNGQPLAKAAAEKHVLVAKDGSFQPIAPTEVTARVNNVDRARAARMPYMLWLAAALGGGLVLFVIGLCTPLIGAFRPHGLVDLHLTT